MFGSALTAAACVAAAAAAVEATVPEGPGLTKSTSCSGTAATAAAPDPVAAAETEPSGTCRAARHSQACFTCVLVNLSQCVLLGTAAAAHCKERRTNSRWAAAAT
jgi:hypothetical protein